MLSRQEKQLSVFFKTCEEFSILGRCVRIIYKHWWSFHQMTDVNKFSRDIVAVGIP